MVLWLPWIYSERTDWPPARTGTTPPTTLGSPSLVTDTLPTSSPDPPACSTPFQQSTLYSSPALRAHPQTSLIADFAFAPAKPNA